MHVCITMNWFPRSVCKRDLSDETESESEEDMSNVTKKQCKGDETVSKSSIE